MLPQVFPPENLVAEAVKTADVIASHSKITVQICKEATNSAFELSLKEGMRFEKRLFQSTFATEDRKEGMTAFVEKRKPEWKDKWNVILPSDPIPPAFKCQKSYWLELFLCQPLPLELWA